MRLSAAWHTAVLELLDHPDQRSFQHRRALCEHAFVTSDGTPHGRFTRAIRNGNLFQAEMAAREMGWVSLPSALDLTALIAQQKPERFEAAAVRLHGRLELEAATLTLPESQLFLAALAQLGRGDETVVDLLRRLIRLAQPTALGPMR